MAEVSSMARKINIYLCIHVEALVVNFVTKHYHMSMRIKKMCDYISRGVMLG